MCSFTEDKRNHSVTLTLFPDEGNIKNFSGIIVQTWKLLFADWTAAVWLLHLHLPLREQQRERMKGF